MSADLRDLIRETVDSDPSLSPEAVAERVMASARTRKDLAALVFPAVVDQVTFVRRGRTRQVESAAFGHVPGETQSGVADAFGSSDPVNPRRTFTDERFYAGHDVGYVPWLTATVEDHLARIDFLERKMWGISATIDRHRTAIKAIEEAGVSCLADLADLSVLSS